MDYVFNGKLAVELFQSAVRKVEAGQPPYDVIFMDVNMPEMDGFQATLEIRKLQKQHDIPFEKIQIVIATAFSDRLEEEQAWSTGANIVTLKPITIQ